MKNITLEQLLEAGCHFGHQVARSNPKARDYIFEARDGIHIIDLAKTKEGLDEAAKYLKTLAQDPSSSIVVVGTKRQASEVLKKEIAEAKKQINGEANLYFVTNKWIGGLLTNFSEVSKNFKKLHDLTKKLDTPSEQQGFTKKEIGEWGKEREKLERIYGGVADMTKTPDALLIIDSHLEKLAVLEALRMKTPTVAITDTNADPFVVNYPVPANDDAVGSLELIINHLIQAWVEGKNSPKVEKKVEEAKEEKKKSKASEDTKKENIKKPVKKADKKDK